ncbi:MAG: glycosyltransferase family 2 protein [Lachnospiraceae bacterium]|nr:glycosyltransferase family 2 protein [Lachnospiraceae bacterium]
MITMSLCMIVKNEEKVLRRCLDSLEGLFEEIIIVDTGSTDDTKKIAAEYTDKVYDYQWIDDFADARNFAFSKATMEYIYSADADEVLDEKNKARFRALKEALLPEVEIVQMWYVNTKEYATTENFDKEYRPKLFRRLRSFTWIDAIHESVNLNPVVYDSDIEILHMPESNHAGRDLRVFRKQIEQGCRLSGKLLTMYARELFIAGETEDFLAAEDGFFQMAMDSRRSPEELDYCYCVMARIWRLKNCPEEFFKWALKNLVISPCSEMCNEVGQFYFDRGDYPEARIWFVNALQETKPILAAVYGDEIPAKMLDKCNEILAS